MTNVNRGIRDYARESWWRWTLSFLIGAAMGVIAFLVVLGIDLLADARLDAATALIDPGGGVGAAWAAFTFISVAYAAVAAALVAFVEPLAAGSGIPEMKTYLNGVQIRGLLALR